MTTNGKADRQEPVHQVRRRSRRGRLRALHRYARARGAAARRSSSDAQTGAARPRSRARLPRRGIARRVRGLRRAADESPCLRADLRRPRNTLGGRATLGRVHEVHRHTPARGAIGISRPVRRRGLRRSERRDGGTESLHRQRVDAHHLAPARGRDAPRLRQREGVARPAPRAPRRRRRGDARCAAGLPLVRRVP